DLRRLDVGLERVAGGVSHDIRNPLNVAQGYATLARDGESPDAFERIQSAHERIGRLATDLAELGRATRLVENLEPVDLASAIQTVWGEIEEESSRLHVDAEGTLLADAKRLRVLLKHLLTNAVTHAGPEATVRAVDLDDGFAVEDDGPGVEPDDRERVFEPGFSTARSGTGYGLAIVSEIGAAHGWSVDAEGAVDGGARFVVRGVNRVDD
ncbi:MAG: sensor histidine kinase, partial [Halobacteriota archaeon]